MEVVAKSLRQPESAESPPAEARRSEGSREWHAPGRNDQSVLATAYRILVKEPDLDDFEFAARMQCSKETARAILDRLSELALMRQIPGEHGGRIFLSPLLAMTQLLMCEQQALSQRERFLRQCADALSAVSAVHELDHEDSRSDACVEEIMSPAALRFTIQHLAANARQTICALSAVPADPFSDCTSAGVADVLRTGPQVCVRQLFPHAIAFDEGAFRYAQRAADAGAQIRLTARLPLRLIIFDCAIAVVPSAPTGRPEGAFVIRQQSVVSAIWALFNAYWERSHPLAEPSEPGSWTPMEAAVIRQLATGAKDDAVARALGTSVRTVRRIIGGLMNRAEVSSRFAFGVWVATQVRSPALAQDRPAT